MELQSDLMKKNKAWAQSILDKDPEFFTRLSQGQAPQVLWIGCADSRVPATEILGCQPGDLFVHRNIANLVVEQDMNCLSVLEYAVEHLKVKHIIICGHTHCGGVKAAMEEKDYGLMNDWLKHIKEDYQKNKSEIDAIDDEHEKMLKMCEINVIKQVNNVSKTSIVQKAWKDSQELSVHGWLYQLDQGLIKDLEVTRSASLS